MDPIRLNRYGLSFVKNRQRTTYRESRRRFASYYPLACTRCGWPFAGQRWRSHTMTDCDRVIAMERRGEFKKIGVTVSLKQQHLRGKGS